MLLSYHMSIEGEHVLYRNIWYLTLFLREYIVLGSVFTLKLDSVGFSSTN